MSESWLITERSVIGNTHLKKGMPNQDAAIAFRPDEEGYPLVLAVADGHGSSNYFRSDRGSRFAVESAKEVLLKFHQDTDPKDIYGIDIREMVCRNIVRKWIDLVHLDIQNNPYNDGEMDLISATKEDSSNRLPRVRNDNEVRPYGSTILCSLVSREYILVVQLGDGDISIVEEGVPPYLCFPEDGKIGEETFSLCLPNAEFDFKIMVIPRSSDRLVRMMLLSTDGYSKSYSSNEGFLQVVSEIYGYASEGGLLSRIPLFGQMKARGQFGKIAENLEGWLEKATRQGSGDDITVALAVNIG
jgi:serine/threonine protein phosphatase PrpC